ncbi:hypothetical protein [Pseudomonas sp. SMV7]|uniref:hypothetical protein n=1 Tax=Pseudomonas sp. SMV7 TaxID=3390194 RepID=UPI003F83E2F5
MSGEQDFKQVKAGTRYDGREDTPLDGWILRPTFTSEKHPNPQVVFSGDPDVGNVLQWDNSGDQDKVDLWFLLSGVGSHLTQSLKVTFDLETSGKAPDAVYLHWEGGFAKEEVLISNKLSFTLKAPNGARVSEKYGAFVLRVENDNRSVMKIGCLRWEYV